MSDAAGPAEPPIKTEKPKGKDVSLSILEKKARQPRATARAAAAWAAPRAGLVAAAGAAALGALWG